MDPKIVSKVRRIWLGIGRVGVPGLPAHAETWLLRRASLSLFFVSFSHIIKRNLLYFGCCYKQVSCHHVRKGISHEKLNVNSFSLLML